MSNITDHPFASILTGGLGFLLMGALAVWRFGVECERAWLNSLAAPQEPFEVASDAHALRALAPADGAATRRRAKRPAAERIAA